MPRFSKFLVLTLVVLMDQSLEAESTGSELEREFGKFLWPIAEHIHRYYFEEIPADSLMSAGVEGPVPRPRPGFPATPSGEATDIHSRPS